MFSHFFTMSKKADYYGHVGSVGIEGLFSMYPMSKRARVTGSQSQSSMTSSQVTNSLKSLVSASEYGEGRRSPNYNCRLHPAKYIKCDPLFKELFFPLLTIARNFGLCSTTAAAFGSGTAALAADADPGSNPTSASAWARSNGVYRGLVLFTVRSDKMANTDAFKLNTTQQTVGKSYLTEGTQLQNVNSQYRRFNNGPYITSNEIPDYTRSTAQTLTWAPREQDVYSSDLLQISEVGNLLDIETAAIQSTNFQHAIGSSSSSEGTTSTAVRAGAAGGVNWDGTGSPLQATNLYYPNLRNTTMRIADGYLELDITNGKNSSCVIELVINSQTKQELDFTPQNFIDEVYQACEYQQNQLRVNGPTQTTADACPGGWQAFYDPEYPLLKLKSAHEKKARQMYREVHRSTHVLSPGQTKMIKVALGSHFYSLGNKTTVSTGTRMQADAPDFGPGNLLVAIGHTGVDQLSMPTLSDSNTVATQFNNYPDTINSSTGAHTVSGTGFWTGKQRAPSEIVLRGTYQEKFYPAYVISEERSNYDNYVMKPPLINGLPGPSGLPVQETVGTIVQDNAGAIKVSSAAKSQ
jgi:hypothetical protein